MNKVEINIEDDSWNKIQGFEEWKNSLDDFFIASIQQTFKSPQSSCASKCSAQVIFRRFEISENSVSLLLTNDENIQRLNKEFRHKDMPTNVLSFPQYNPQDICKIDTIDENLDIFLGDIAMSHEQIMRESKQFNLKFFERCSHLFVHGVLHLLGMDHINPEDQEKMENMEIEILNEFGLDNPYILKGEKDNL